MSQMANFKVKLIRNRKRIFDDRGEVEEFLHCMDNDGVHFGMNGVFTVDYAYFGHVSTK